MQTKPRDIPYCGVSRKKILTAEPTVREEHLARLLYYITERYRIHRRKDLQNKPYPWTKDPFLREYRFTNVFREDDKVSRALIESISHNDNLTLEDKIANTFLFRAWTNPDTFTDLGGPWTAEQIYNGIELKQAIRPIYKALQEKDPDRAWWTAAYNQGGLKRSLKFRDESCVLTQSTKGMTKGYDYELSIPLRVFHIGPWLQQHNTYAKLMSAKSQKVAYQAIHEIKGFAVFLAYQTFIDLTYIPEFPFSENGFTIAGPGCRIGLDYLFSDYDGLSYEEALFWLRNNLDDLFYGLYRKDCFENFNIDVPQWNPEYLFRDRPKEERYINLMSLENCLCEYHKYMKLVRNKGRLRKKYIPL